MLPLSCGSIRVSDRPQAVAEGGRGALKHGEGRLAQLVEHLVYTERVGGSSPSPPTIAGMCITKVLDRPFAFHPKMHSVQLG
jgi:hypothetical protein